MRIKFQIIFFLILTFLFSSCTKTKREFWPDGKVRSEISMKGGKYNGKASWYNEDGSIKMVCFYKDNQLEGELIRFYPNGKKQELITYKGGIKNGRNASWYENGNITVEAFFTNDAEDGNYSEYYENGQPRIEGAYKKGLFNGKWIYYDETGGIVGEGNFTDGSGKQRSFWPDGHVKHEINYLNNLKEGPETEFDENGKPVSVKIFKQGKLVKQTVRPSL